MRWASPCAGHALDRASGFRAHGGPVAVKLGHLISVWRGPSSTGNPDLDHRQRDRRLAPGRAGRSLRGRPGHQRRRPPIPGQPWRQPGAPRWWWKGPRARGIRRLSSPWVTPGPPRLCWPVGCTAVRIGPVTAGVTGTNGKTTWPFCCGNAGQPARALRPAGHHLLRRRHGTAIRLP